MTRETYQQSLTKLCGEAIAMGFLVIERLGMGLESLATGNGTLVRDVVEGDSDVNEMYLAQYALIVKRNPTPEVVVDEIGQDAMTLLERNLEAYETEDIEACWEIAASVDDTDSLCHRASKTITHYLIERDADRDNPWEVERLFECVSCVLLTIRDFERVADHAVNIVVRSLYTVENDPELVY